jgi:hypothetical protein
MVETLQQEPAPPTESQFHHVQSNIHERYSASSGNRDQALARLFDNDQTLS